MFFFNIVVDMLNHIAKVQQKYFVLCLINIYIRGLFDATLQIMFKYDSSSVFCIAI